MDTGADISIISEETRKVLFPNQKIYKSDLILKMYTGEPITIIGNLHVRVQYQDQFAKVSPSGGGRQRSKPTRPELAEVPLVRLEQNRPVALHSAEDLELCSGSAQSAF